MPDQTVQQAAKILRKAQESRTACEPIREILDGQESETAYAIQAINTAFYLKQGRRMV